MSLGTRSYLADAQHGGVACCRLVSLSAALLLLMTVNGLRAQDAKRSSALQETERTDNTEAVGAVDADLQEAITMLEQKKHSLVAFDFLPAGFVVESLAQASRNTERSNGRLPFDFDPKFAAQLKQQLVAAQVGEKTFNRSNTLVEIAYVIKPAVQVPSRPPEVLPVTNFQPKDSTKGLGEELAEVCAAAVSLLEEDKVDEFILAMYPIPELARLTEGIDLHRIVLRSKSSPEMKAAMIRDLKLAQNHTPKRNGNVAEFQLEPLVEGDPSRVLKFELVQGDWRFFDSAAETREIHHQLMSTPVAAYTIPGSKGVLILRWHDAERCWKLATMPVIAPIP